MTEEDQDRILSKEEVRRILWSATRKGLDPDATAPTHPEPPAEYDLARLSDVDEVKSEIAAKFRTELVDKVCNKMAPSMTPEEVRILRGLLLDSLGQMLDY
jgi:hypothetical protein